MEPLPHNYHVKANAATEGIVITQKQVGEPLEVMPPKAFGGPGDRWSPEELITAAVADCFILTFRALAGYKELKWNRLSCSTTGTLDKQEGRLQFTRFYLEVTLEIDASAPVELAGELLQKAKQTCLVSNSLKADFELHYEVRSSGQVNQAAN